MSRYLTCFLVIGFLAAAAPAAVSFDWVEVANGIGPGNLFNCYDLNMTVDTNIAMVEMYILSDAPAGNDFYQDLGSPGTGYDTYVTFPEAYVEVGEAINIVGGERSLTFSSLLLDIAWAPDGEAYTPSGSGTHHVARVTVKDGLWYGSWQVYGQETGTIPLPEYSASGVWPLYSLIQGDAEEDRDVDQFDLGVLLNNWGTGTLWTEGNFDGGPPYDVDQFDLGLLLNNWGDTYPPEPAEAPAAAPEPATICLLAVGLAAVICKRKSSK